MDEINSSTWDLIHQGMEQMVASSTTFTGLDFSMAGKTGTAQHNELHADHVLFVGYAPAEQLNYRLQSALLMAIIRDMHQRSAEILQKSILILKQPVN